MSICMKVECPQCGKIWTVPQGTSDITCNCHLYCENGTKPEDCNLTKVSFEGSLGYPTGMHVSNVTGNDELHRTYYCNTHGVYSDKQPILIECDWQSWLSRRAPRKFRDVEL